MATGLFDGQKPFTQVPILLLSKVIQSISLHPQLNVESNDVTGFPTTDVILHESSVGYNEQYSHRLIHTEYSSQSITSPHESPFDLPLH